MPSPENAEAKLGVVVVGDRLEARQLYLPRCDGKLQASRDYTVFLENTQPRYFTRERGLRNV